MALAIGDMESTMEIVMKNIYSSCDIQNTNLVPTSKLIEFIMPYLLEDLSALDSLKSSLDPDNKDVPVTSEKFYEVMNEWAQKIASSNDDDDDFIRTPSQLDVMDEKRLPYIQSTPRASFGQKLLRCEGLLNLSNESFYNISASVETKENSTVGAERTFLEEQVKRLEHQLNKVTGEMEMVKIQLSLTEEQNDQLHSDLERCRTRLSSEQQVNDHLQKNKSCMDELREEIRFGKRRIEELNKKLSQYEKDNIHVSNYMQTLEKENTELEEKLEHLTRREQDWKKELFDMKTELDIKDHEIISITKLNEELKLKLSEKKNQVDQLTCENELLDYKKQGLEKVLSSRRYSTSSQHKTFLEETSGFFNRDQSYEEEFFFESQLPDYRNSPHTSLQAELFQVENQFDKQIKNGTGHLDYEEEIQYFKNRNDTLRTELERYKEDNVRIQNELANAIDNSTELQIKLSHIMFDKHNMEQSLKEAKQRNEGIEKKIELHETQNSTLENIRIEQREKITSAHIFQEEEITKYKNKFNFETAYKTLQAELNENNRELLELRQMNNEYKDMLCKLTNSNQALEKSLKHAKSELKENEKTTEKVFSLNENIEETANQVQVHIENKKLVISELQELNTAFESNVKKLEAELRNKMKEVSQLKDILKSNEGIKNIMWSDNKKLENELVTLRQGNQNLIMELEESENFKKDCKEEYDTILSQYKEEVAKNGELLSQISSQKDELSQLLGKVTSLKAEVDCIRHVQKEDKEKINQKLLDYENVLQNYETKTKSLRNVNEQLKIELENEKKKQLKEDKVSEELFNKLQAFETMLQNLETKISDLENQNELLKSELECERGKIKKNHDIDTSSDCSSLSFNFEKASLEPKNRSFEKQKITIDRLKDKLEKLEGQLLNERSRCDVLRKMLNDKENMEDKWTRLKEDFDKANHLNTGEKLRLQNVIDEMAKKNKDQEQHYKQIVNASNEKVLQISSKLSQFEEQNKKLLLDLSQKESLISKYLELNRNNTFIIENLNKKLQEMEVQQSKISLESIERKNAYADLLSEYKTFQQKTEVQQSKVFLELTEKENSYASLLLEYKTFQEKLSKTDDHKEKELMDVEERINHSRMILESLDAELEAARERVSQSKTENDCGLERNVRVIATLNECTNELFRTFHQVTEKWKNIFGDDPNYKKLPVIKMCHTLEVGEGISVLNDNIKVIASMLEILSAKAQVPMDESDNQQISPQPLNSDCDSKTVKKFTLRPPRLLLNRPVSPDSPCVEVDVPPFEQPNQKTNKEIASEDCPSFNETNFEFTRTKTEEHSSGTHLSTLSVDLPFQDAFPHVTDNFLEKLGLHASSPKQKLSRDETEKLFTTFAIEIALDSRDIKDRLQKQKQQCLQQHKKCFYLIKDISMRLRDHRCIGASDPINPVFVLLEDVRFLLQEIIQSAGQLGILTCENRMMKCWNLVTNYMAMIKQDAKKIEEASPNRSREEKVSEELKLKSLREVKSNPVIQKTDTKKKPKEPSGKNKPTKERKEDKSCLKNFTTAMKWIIFFAFLFLVLLISIHWQCKMTTDHQICPLDDIIRNIRVGPPPY
ncbi:hypothetical protein JTB14_037093 [Gonioctena quinquepunctata]|nr:hypothetical protein JTB14_037093 [Gonioctena quinquepunctata]